MSGKGISFQFRDEPEENKKQNKNICKGAFRKSDAPFPYIKRRNVLGC